jgi:ABC-type enterochelin transport system permease subunit
MAFLPQGLFYTNDCFTLRVAACLLFVKTCCFHKMDAQFSSELVFTVEFMETRIVERRRRHFFPVLGVLTSSVFTVFSFSKNWMVLY